MRTKAFITMAALALVATACSNDEESDNWAGEIRLSSGIEVQETRSTHGLDASLMTGEAVHVWVDDAETPNKTVTTKKLYENNVLMVGGGGALSGGTAMYFPQTGNAVDIYALHTNATWEGNTFPDELIHTVAINQKSDATNIGEGYQGSDLVFAKSTNVERKPNTVTLGFKHLLSKIEVVLVQGAGSPSIAKVEILNTKLGAKFTPSKTQDFSVTADGEITSNNPIEIDTDLTSSSDAEGTEENKKALNEAIIVPQTLAVKTEFIRITTTDGGILTYSLPEDKTFEAATKYRYTITANLTELKVTSSISAWTNGGSGTGTAEMK